MVVCGFLLGKVLALGWAMALGLELEKLLVPESAWVFELGLGLALEQVRALGWVMGLSSE